MSADETFFDTNVLIYLTDQEPGKAARTEDLLTDGGRISVQPSPKHPNAHARPNPLQVPGWSSGIGYCWKPCETLAPTKK